MIIRDVRSCQKTSSSSTDTLTDLHLIASSCFQHSSSNQETTQMSSTSSTRERDVSLDRIGKDVNWYHTSGFVLTSVENYDDLTDEGLLAFGREIETITKRLYPEAVFVKCALDENWKNPIRRKEELGNISGQQHLDFHQDPDMLTRYSFVEVSKLDRGEDGGTQCNCSSGGDELSRSSKYIVYLRGLWQECVQCHCADLILGIWKPSKSMRNPVLDAPLVFTKPDRKSVV